MIQILLLDQDRYYCKQVCAEINTRWNTLICFDSLSYPSPLPIPGQGADSNFSKRPLQESSDMQTFGAVDMNMLSIEWDSTLVIYHPQQFFHPPENAHTIILSEIPVDLSESADGKTPQPYGIYKYGSLQDLLKTIDCYLIHHPDLSMAVRSIDMTCILGSACPALRQRAIDEMKQEKLEQGRKVVQIDFCPPYLSDQPVSHSSGYSLSDALLRLMADDLPYEDLGIFLVPGADGTLQFRPVERADDLFECSLDHIRRFVELVRRWMVHTNSQYHVFIQCFAVPFSFIYAIAVQSDELLLINQEKASARTISYNKEISHLLANLPGSCKVQELLVPCSAVLE